MTWWRKLRLELFWQVMYADDACVWGAGLFMAGLGIGLGF